MPVKAGIQALDEQIGACPGKANVSEELHR